MLEISKACYLDEILFGKANTKERYEILSFIELSQRMNPGELVDHLQKHLAMRMFLIGQNITAADIMVLF